AEFGGLDAIEAAHEGMAVTVTVDDAVPTVTLTEHVACISQSGHKGCTGITTLPQCRHFGFDFLRIDAAFLRPKIFPVWNLAASSLARLGSWRRGFVMKLLLQLGAGLVMREIGEAVGSDGHGVRIDPAPDNMTVGSPLLLVLDLKTGMAVQP